MNVAGRVLEAAERHPTRPALVTVLPGGHLEQVTYAQLVDRALAAAADLAADVRPGRRVLLAAPTAGDAPYGMLAVLWLGGVVVLPDAAATRPRLADLESLTRPDVVLLAPGYRGGARGRRRGAPVRRGLPTVARRPVEPRSAPVVAQVGDEAVLVARVGNTLLPDVRVVAYSHDSLAACLDVWARLVPLRDDDVVWSPSLLGLFRNLAAGGTCLLTPDTHPIAPIDPARVVASLRAGSATVAHGPPAWWSLLAAWSAQTRQPLPLRRIVVTRAPMAPRRVADLMQVAPGAEVLAVYGNLGAEPIATADGAEILAAASQGTLRGAGLLLGQPVPGVSIRLVDAAGDDVARNAAGDDVARNAAGDDVAGNAAGDTAGESVDAPGEDAASHTAGDAVGEVAARGPHLGRVLHDGRPVPAGDGDGTEHRLGDLAHRDEAGRLWWAGTPAAAICHRGGVLYPVPVEAVAETLPFVRQAALVGIAGSAPDASQRSVLAIVLATDGNVPERWQVVLRDHCVAALGTYPVDLVQTVDGLPVDPERPERVDYAALRQQLIDADSLAHWRSWLRERFPLPLIAAVTVSYAAAQYALAWASVLPTGGPIPITWRYPAIVLALAAMLFHLRVQDDVRGDPTDRLRYPGRVLSRGLVTYLGLRRLGLAAVALEVVLAATMGAPALVALAGVLGVSWLIGRRFFLPAGDQRLAALRSATVLLCLPVMALFAFSAATGRFLWQAPLPVLVYAWVAVLVGLGLEAARVRLEPEDGRMGPETLPDPAPVRSVVLMLLPVAGACVLAGSVGYWLDVAGWFYIVLAALPVLLVTTAVAYVRNAARDTAARLVAAMSLFVFALDWSLALALLLAGSVLIGP